MITNILLSAILGAVIVQCILLGVYLRRKKPGPKPKSKRREINKQFSASPGIPAEIPPRPRKRFRAQDYPEVPMK